MDIHLQKIVEALPDAKNHTELLLKAFHLNRAKECKDTTVITRNENVCKKCLTDWTKGQFTVKILPANHHRKKRRTYQIDRLTKSLKSTDNSSNTTNKRDIKKLKYKLQRLQKLNNHVAMYTCLVCNHQTKVVLWKPFKIQQKDKTEECDGDKTVVEDTLKKPKKIKGKKIKKAGLKIPPPRDQSIAPKSNHIYKWKLANALNTEVPQNQSALNKFLS